MERNIEISMLYNIYGKMLTEKQRTIVDLYYNNDLSLREIAENEGISAQGVRDALKNAEKSLYDYEKNIGLFKLQQEVNERVDKISASIEKLSKDMVQKEVLEIKNLMNR